MLGRICQAGHAGPRHGRRWRALTPATARRMSGASGNSRVPASVALRESVRQYDYDHYLCGLLLPIDTRPAYFAIRAMNVELATIKDSIRSNHLTGKIRVQWWRERVSALYESPGGATRETPLLLELDRAIAAHGLTRRWFERLLDARDQDLDVDQPLSLEDLERYAEQTASSLLYLTLECLGVRDGAADRAASHVGAAVGLATLLRGTAFHAMRQQVYLPEDLMLRHGVSVYDLAEATENPELGMVAAPVVADVARRAQEHVAEARALMGDVPKAARAALLPLVSMDMHLAELEAVQFNAFDPKLQQRSALRLHLQVLKHYFLGRY